MKEILSLRKLQAIAAITCIGIMSASCSKEEGIAPVSSLTHDQAITTKLDDRSSPLTEQVTVDMRPEENAVARTRPLITQRPSLQPLRENDIRITPTMPVIRPNYENCLLCGLGGRRPTTVDSDLQGFAPVR